MCRYCDREYGRSLYEDAASDVYIDYSDGNAFLCIYTCPSYELFNEKIEIKYCPMCGEDLRREV